MKLTKEELAILANAPEGAKWHAQKEGCYCEAYLNSDKSKVFVIGKEEQLGWLDSNATCTSRYNDISDLRKRKEQEDKLAKIVDAVNWLQAELTDANCFFRNENELYLSITSGNLKYLALDNEATDTVCTIDEFNQCVRECSYYAGADLYDDYNRSDKQLLEPVEKPLEWLNGDECRYSHDIDHEYIYIGSHSHGDGHYVFSETKGITYISNGYLVEPLTAEQKAAKEREDKVNEIWNSISRPMDCEDTELYLVRIAEELYLNGYRLDK